MLLNDPLLDSGAKPQKDLLPPLDFVWLEITGKCNLRCTHCYADSSPDGHHGILTLTEWEAIISDAKNLGASTIQFIGGEPTLHPDFASLVRFAAKLGLNIEVFTNLVGISQRMWALFQECQVAIATSFYSYQPDIHNRITGQVGSQQKTLSNIKNVLIRGLSLRVGMIKVFPEQDISETEKMLRSLGITNIGIDKVRGVGRGLSYDKPHRPSEALCGACWFSKAAVDADGWVYPCVFSRWLKIGNVKPNGFEQVMHSHRMKEVRSELKNDFSSQGRLEASQLDSCDPDCNPACSPRCQPTCSPRCSPTCNPIACNPRQCWPSFE